MGQQFDAAKIGMWLFLVTEVLLFGGLFVGYGIMHARHPEAFLAAHHHLDKTMGAINTVVLLISSFIYQFTGFGFVDSLGALGLIYFSINEGRESFDKAKGLECSCEDENCND